MYLKNNEIEKLTLTDELDAHLSIHFANCADDIAGSKFFADFAKSGEDLLNIIKCEIRRQDLSFKWNKNRCEVSIFFDKKIGFDSLIKLSEIDNSLVYLEPREESNTYEVKKTMAYTPMETNQLNMILLKCDEKIKILTIFPGVLAPPIPNKKYHTEKEFAKFDVFWKEYVFIEK